jgi:amidase
VGIFQVHVSYGGIMDNLLKLDAMAQATAIRNGEISVSELIGAAIARIESLDGQINAVIQRRFDRVKNEVASGLPKGPFHGVPFLVKDSLPVKDEPYHFGMRVLKEIGYHSDHDSYLGERFKRSGFAILGKTNLSEMALSPVTDSVAYGPTRNPWDLSRTAGGSSGGSAAAVAAGFVPVAHGSDAGGSIRIPASACGVVGLLPTRGRITLGPDFGEQFGQRTQEHVLTRSVRDSARVLDVCAGPAPGDPHKAPPPNRPWSQEVKEDPGQLRIGIRTLRYSDGGWDSPCGNAVEETGRLLSDLGHEVEESNPTCLDDLTVDPIRNFMQAIKHSHVASELNRVGALIGRKLGPSDVEPNTWTAAEAAREVTGVEVTEAFHQQHHFSRKMAEWWEMGFDVLVTPTLATLPFRFRGKSREKGRLKELDVQRSDGEKALGLATFTWPFNVSGQPAITLPLYWTAEGFPVGVQFVARFGREDILFRLAGQLETARPWAGKWPVIGR